ncbi:hypothetical protein KO465_09985 [Candidatus Micrarchaeota archaeon]|jgi:hypothetical protein|nr:hypothetical protein [Candidatus Micrarchaeota archaeon]
MSYFEFENMEAGEIFLYFAINMLITGVAYCTIPIISKLTWIKRKGITKSGVQLLVAVNAIGTCILFSVVKYLLWGDLSFTIIPAFIWGFVSYQIIKKGLDFSLKYEDYYKDDDFGFNSQKPILTKSTRDMKLFLESLESDDGREIKWKWKDYIIVNSKKINVYDVKSATDSIRNFGSIYIDSEGDINSEQVPRRFSRKKSHEYIPTLLNDKKESNDRSQIANHEQTKSDLTKSGYSDLIDSDGNSESIHIEKEVTKEIETTDEEFRQAMKEELLNKIFNNKFLKKTNIVNFNEDAGYFEHMYNLYIGNETLNKIKQQNLNTYLTIISAHAFGIGAYIGSKEKILGSSVISFSDYTKNNLWQELKKNDAYETAIKILEIDPEGHYKKVLDKLIMESINSAKTIDLSFASKKERLKIFMKSMYDLGYSFALNKMK